MKLHRLCAIFPELDTEELADLVEDIKANGLREPITTLDGQVLDGQNRLKACDIAGVKPQFDAFIGKDPLAFVISKNLKRRHLTTGQRAMIAASISECKNSYISDSAAAKQMHVSRQSVHIAKGVRRRSPTLAKKVRSGKMSLNEADEESKPRSRMPNPVIPPEPVKPELPPAQQARKLTPERFQALMDEMENLIDPKADHKPFGLIANKFAKRMMNFGADGKNTSAYTS